jgi:hypothetical protein
VCLLQYPIHQTREYRASLDLDPRPAAMCLPQVINAMTSLPWYLSASFKTHRPSVHCVWRKTHCAGFGGRGWAVTENLNLPFGHFPRSCAVYVSILQGRCCSGVVLLRVFRNHGTFRESPNHISISEKSQISPPSFPCESEPLYVYGTKKMTSVKNTSGVLKEQRVSANGCKVQGHQCA